MATLEAAETIDIEWVALVEEDNTWIPHMTLGEIIVPDSPISDQSGSKWLIQ